MLKFAAFASSMLLALPVALAQPDPTPAPAEADGTAVALPEEDLTVADPTGTEENPDVPPGDEDPTTPGAKATVAPRPDGYPAGYPLEEVWRPLTLPEFTSEIALDLRTTLNPFISNIGLRGRFGVTDTVEIGLSYNAGGLYDDGSGTTFNTGKSIGVDATIGIQPWLAVRAQLPFYVDPFSMGLTLGAPLKFRFGQRFAFGGLGDLLTFRLKNFAPSLAFEAINEAYAAAVESNTVLDAGSLALTGWVAYQLKPDLALIGNLGVIYNDFSNIESDYPFKATLQWTKRQRFDLAVTAGFETLDAASETFGVQLSGRVRI